MNHIFPTKGIPNDSIKSKSALALQAAPTDNAEARICAFIETGISQLVEELERNPKIVELAEFVCEDEAGLEVLNAHIRWKRVRVAQEIQAGVAEGILKAEDPEALAATLLTRISQMIDNFHPTSP